MESVKPAVDDVREDVAGKRNGHGEQRGKQQRLHGDQGPRPRARLGDSVRALQTGDRKPGCERPDHERKPPSAQGLPDDVKRQSDADGIVDVMAHVVELQ